MAGRLDTTVNIVTLVTCVAVLSAISTQYISSSKSRPTAAPRIRVGEALPSVVDFKPGEATHTLLMYLKSDCKYCALNIPLYQRLSEAAERQGSRRIKLRVLTTDASDTASSYIKANGLPPLDIKVIPVDLIPQLRLPGTPTLVLADDRGIVKRVWFGALDATRQEEVFRTLFDAAGG
jgi:hypothetical protein